MGDGREGERTSEEAEHSEAWPGVGEKVWDGDVREGMLTNGRTDGLETRRRSNGNPLSSQVMMDAAEVGRLPLSPLGFAFAGSATRFNSSPLRAWAGLESCSRRVRACLTLEIGACLHAVRGGTLHRVAMCGKNGEGA